MLPSDNRRSSAYATRERGTQGGTFTGTGRHRSSNQQHRSRRKPGLLGCGELYLPARLARFLVAHPPSGDAPHSSFSLFHILIKATIPPAAPHLISHNSFSSSLPENSTKQGRKRIQMPRRLRKWKLCRPQHLPEVLSGKPWILSLWCRLFFFFLLFVCQSVPADCDYF